MILTDAQLQIAVKRAIRSLRERPRITATMVAVEAMRFFPNEGLDTHRRLVAIADVRLRETFQPWRN